MGGSPKDRVPRKPNKKTRCSDGGKSKPEERTEVASAEPYVEPETWHARLERKNEHLKTLIDGEETGEDDLLDAMEDVMADLVPVVRVLVAHFNIKLPDEFGMPADCDEPPQMFVDGDC